MKKIIIQNRAEKKKRGKWYYIVLAVTIMVVGAVAAITKNTAERVLENNVVTSEIAIEKSVADEPVKKVITEEKKAEPVSAVQIPDINTKLEFARPVNGEVIKGHSNTELVYSKTLGDWRIHKGVDVACDIGTDVVACESGVVDAVYLDDRLGYTIVISHANDTRTRYANLDAETNVKPGQAVTKGDKIGIVGDTSEFEIADVSHLHFEVIRGEDNVAPDLYIEGY